MGKNTTPTNNYTTAVINNLKAIGEEVKKHGKGGRPPRFATAQDLLNCFCDYVALCSDNPVERNVAQRMRRGERGDSVESAKIKVQRPLTLDGFCLFAHICMPWATFKQHCKDRVNDAEQFRIVIDACEQAIRDNQIVGAMVGEFSERLTARLNGITDKQEVELNNRQPTLSMEDYVKFLRGETVRIDDGH